MPSTRRRVLATLAASSLVSVVGCVGDGRHAGDGSSTSNRTSPPSSTPSNRSQSSTAASTSGTPSLTATSTADLDALDVTGAVVQTSLYRPWQTDWSRVVRADGQFVFVGVDASGVDSPPTVDRFALADGTGHTHYPRRFDWIRPPVVQSLGRPYEPAATDPATNGWIAFEVPRPFSGTSELALRDGSGGVGRSWSLPESATTAMQEPAPSFETLSVDLPKSVPVGGQIDTSVVVENEGDGEGVFRAVFDRSWPISGPWGLFDERRLAAGQRETWTGSMDAPTAADGVSEVRLVLASPSGTRKFAVAVDS